MIKWLEKLHSRGAAQTLVLFWTMGLTTWAMVWCSQFAQAGTDGLQTAAVVGAVMAPLATLQGFVFKWYSTQDASNG